MTLVLVLVVIVPLGAILGLLVSSIVRLAADSGAVAQLKIPPPPAGLSDLPFAGHDLAARWGHWSAMSRDELAAALAPYAANAVKWTIARAGNLGMLLVQMTLSAIIMPVLFARGEAVAGWVRLAGRRLGGTRCDDALLLAARATRGVALGVVVTAVVQGAVAALGLFVAGVPFAPALSVVAIVLCVAQVGPLPVLLPSVVWLFYRGDTSWGTVLAVWTIPATLIDNLVRPFVVSKDANLPALLVFIGVIGGLASFGLIGVFIGPVVLAVAQAVLDAWVRSGPPEDDGLPPGPCEEIGGAGTDPAR
jgi:predicted PurR-regulated permease PerM